MESSSSLEHKEGGAGEAKGEAKGEGEGTGEAWVRGGAGAGGAKGEGEGIGEGEGGGEAWVREGVGERATGVGVECPVNVELAAEPVCCRFCFDSGGDDLISPCRCRGTQRFVHRSCLDEWRTSRGWFTFTHCSTCKAPFHLRRPRSALRLLCLPGVAPWILRSLAALLLFVALQLLALWRGTRGARLSEQGCIRSMAERSRLFCYTAGVWELYLHSFAGLALEIQGALRQHAYLLCIFCFRRFVLPPAVAAVLGACHLCSHPYEPPLPPHHPLSLHPWSLLPIATGTPRLSAPIESHQASSSFPTASLGLNASSAVARGAVCRLPKVHRRATLRPSPVWPASNRTLAVSQMRSSLGAVQDRRAVPTETPGLPGAAQCTGPGAGGGLYGPLLGALRVPPYAAGSPQEQAEVFRRMLWASAACGAYAGAVAVALGLGLVAGSFTVYELLPALLPSAKVLRESLAQEFPVQHVEGEYGVPASNSQQRILCALWLLT